MNAIVNGCYYYDASLITCYLLSMSGEKVVRLFIDAVSSFAIVGICRAMRQRVRRFLRGGKFSTARFLHSFYVNRHRELLNCKGLVLRFTVPNVAAPFVAGIVRTVSIGLRDAYRAIAPDCVLTEVNFICRAPRLDRIDSFGG
jgi:hypothetical protein